MSQEPRSGQIVRDTWGLPGRKLKRSDPFRVPVGEGSEDVPYNPPWYFHPNRHGTICSVHHSRTEVERYQERLEALDDSLALSWHPTKHYWQIWVKDARVESPWCRGWRRLFTSERLGEPIFWRLYHMDQSRWGGAVRSANRVDYELARQELRRSEKRDEEAREWARDHWRYMQVKNIGAGSKFSEYWSGS